MIISLSAVHVTGTGKRIQSVQTHLPKSVLNQDFFACWAKDWNRSFRMYSIPIWNRVCKTSVIWSLGWGVKYLLCHVYWMTPAFWFDVISFFFQIWCPPLWNILIALSRLLLIHSGHHTCGASATVTSQHKFTLFVTCLFTLFQLTFPVIFRSLLWQVFVNPDTIKSITISHWHTHKMYIIRFLAFYLWMCFLCVMYFCCVCVGFWLPVTI